MSFIFRQRKNFAKCWKRKPSSRSRSHRNLKNNADPSQLQFQGWLPTRRRRLTKGYRLPSGTRANRQGPYDRDNRNYSASASFEIAG